MRRTAALLLVLMAGCSTAPVADLLDWIKPGRLPPGPYRGGVGAPPPEPPAPGPFVPPVPVVPAVPAPPTPIP